MTRLKKQIVGLNEFLTAIYKSETKLSDLLENCGFNSEQISLIRSKYLEDFTISFVEKLKTRITEFSDGERSQTILFRRYGIDGNPPGTLQSIGELLGISRERIRQLEKKALRLCRHKKNLQNFESDLRESARTYLGETNEIYERTNS